MFMGQAFGSVGYSSRNVESRKDIEIFFDWCP